MYPTIYHLFKDLLGIEIAFLQVVYTFGFFMVLAFLGGSYVMSLEFKRKEKEGLMHASKKKILAGAKATIQELAIQGLWGFVVGYKIVLVALNWEGFMDDPQGHILSLQGNIPGGILGAAVFGFLKWYEKEKSKLPKPELKEVIVRPYEHVGNITFIALIAGLLGAKLFHNLEYIGDFIEDPIGELFSFSGLTFYGGLILAGASIIYYTWKNKINVPGMLDSSAPGLMLAYGIGRIGCQVSGDGDWGIVNNKSMPEWLQFLPDWTWAYSYPNNVIRDGIPIPDCYGKFCYILENPVYPTPFYEAVMGIGLFALLWSLRKKFTISGTVFAFYLMINGIERFFIEKIRVNATYDILNIKITQAEILSVCIFILGIIFFWYLWKNHAGSKRIKSHD